MDNIWFSDHAFVRARERLSLIKEELQRIIQDQKTVNIGSEPKTNREHLLFYSIHDDMCFVAVFDRVESVVITILPIDYHDNVAWKVSIDAQKEAKALIIKSEPNLEVFIDPAPVAPKPASKPAPKPTVFKVFAFLWDSGHKTIKCGSQLASEFDDDIKKFVTSPQLDKIVREGLAAKGYETCKEATLTITFGRLMSVQVFWRRGHGY